MTPDDILLNSQISVLLIHQQKSFLLQSMARNTETHSRTMCRELETLEFSVINRVLPPKASPHGSGNSVEEEAERLPDMGSMHKACMYRAKLDGVLVLREEVDTIS